MSTSPRRHTVVDSPVGPLTLVGDGEHLVGLYMDGQAHLPPTESFGERDDGDAVLQRAATQLGEYFSGTRETFGQTLQEAAATALPVVAPARGGPLDLIEHGVTGLLFDPDDPGDLARQVASVATDPMAWQRRALLGEAALARVTGRSWSVLTDELIGHYERVRALRPQAPRLS